jgi:hypothetical protein
LCGSPTIVEAFVATGLLALLDDITSILDDVSAMTKRGSAAAVALFRRDVEMGCCDRMVTIADPGSPEIRTEFVFPDGCMSSAICCCSRWRSTVLRSRTVRMADLRPAGGGGLRSSLAGGGATGSGFGFPAARVFGSMVTTAGASIATGFRFRGGRL